jgi:hypothetical protein
MIRIAKLILVLIVLGLAALTGYAFIGDLSPNKQRVEQPVTLTPE